MEPLDFSAGSRTWRTPDGWRLPFVLTAWQPTPDELAQLAAGEPVALWLLGDTLPPCALTVGDPCRNDETLVTSDRHALGVLRAAIRRRGEGPDRAYASPEPQDGPSGGRDAET